MRESTQKSVHNLHGDDLYSCLIVPANSTCGNCSRVAQGKGGRVSRSPCMISMVMTSILVLLYIWAVLTDGSRWEGRLITFLYDRMDYKVCKLV